MVNLRVSLIYVQDNVAQIRMRVLAWKALRKFFYNNLHDHDYEQQ